MRVLILISLLCYIAFSAPVLNGAEYTQTVTINHEQVAETNDNFLYQRKIPRTGDIALSVDSANDVAFTNVNDTTRRSRWVIVTPDTIYLYAHIAVSSTVDTSYRLQYGKSLNETNASATFTNCGITNFWGMNESSGTTISDYADAVTGTLISSATLNNSTIFKTGISCPLVSSRVTFSSSNILSNTNKFSLSFFVNTGSDISINRAFITRGLDTGFRLNILDGTILCIIGSAGYLRTAIGVITANTPTTISLIYDGSQAVNGNKVRLLINGAFVPWNTSSGSIPSAIPDESSETFMIGFPTGEASYIGNYDELLYSADIFNNAIFTSRYNMLFTPSTFSTLGTPALNELTGSRWSAYKSAFKSAYKPAYK